MSTITHMAPQTAKGRATRLRILNAARKAAIEAGGHFELAAVTKDAGVVPGMVHRYFGSKEGLVSAVLDDFYDRFHGAVYDQVLIGPWSLSERRRLELGVAFHFEDPFSVVLHGSLAKDPGVAAREAERIADIVSRAARSIRKAQKKGELPVGVDPALAGAAMFGAMRQVMVEALSRPRRPAQRAVVDMLWRQVCAAVKISPDEG